MFDFDVAIGGVALLALIPGIVECLKQFGVSGKGNIVVALVSGALLFGAAGAIERGLMPSNVIPWVELGVSSLAGGLTACGYYSMAKRAGNAVLSRFNKWA